MIVMEVAAEVLGTAQALVPMDIPKPGNPTQPPGFEKITDILGWIKWLCLAGLVAALMFAGAKIAFGSRHGDGEEHAGRVGKVLIGTIIVTAAGALIGFIAA